MKFIAPELEVKMFNVNDILTASGETEGPIASETPNQFGYLAEGECVGNASDNWIPDCL